MKNKILLIFGILFFLPCSSLASWIDEYDFSDIEVENIEQVFDEDLFEHFVDRYNLTDSQTEYFFQDPEVQRLLQVLYQNRNSVALTKSNLNLIFDSIDNVQSIKNWKYQTLSSKVSFLSFLGISSADFSSQQTYRLNSLDSYNLNDGNSYIYTTTNCKQYRIQYLPRQQCYTSPDLRKREYFITKEHLERYIDSKNKGTCKPKNTSYLPTTFDNRSKLRYIAPNGKIYYTDPVTYGWTSTEIDGNMPPVNLVSLQNIIKNQNPLYI